MKKHIVLSVFVFLTLFVFLIAGCGTVSLKSVPYQNGLAKGAAYSTPVKVVAVDVSYVKQQKSRKIFGHTVESDNRIPKIIALSASITEETQPDPRNIFIVDVDQILNAGTLSASLDYNFTDEGLLSSASSDLQDKKKEIIEQTAGASLSLAKLVAIAQKKKNPVEELPLEIQPIARRIMAIYKKIGKSDEELAPESAKPAKKAAEGSKIRKKLMTELKKLHAEIKFYTENNQEITTTSDVKSVRFIVPYDLSGFVGPKKDYGSADSYYETTFSLGGLVQEVTDTFAPKIKVRLYITEEMKGLAGKTFAKEADGFVHRLPIATRLVVRIENPGMGKFNSINAYVGMPQLSRFFNVPVKNKHFGKRKTKLKFSAATGGLIHFGATSDSSYEQMAKTANKTAGAIQSDFSDIKTAGDDLAKEIIRNKRYLISAEKSNLKTTLEIEELKKEIEALKTGL